MQAQGNPRVRLIQRLLSEPRRLIVTILIGNEFVNVAASVLSAAMVIEVLGAEHKFFNLFIMVPVLLIVGEITPKTLAIRNNVAFATFESGPIDAFARFITPLRWVIRVIADLVHDIDRWSRALTRQYRDRGHGSYPRSRSGRRRNARPY